MMFFILETSIKLDINKTQDFYLFFLIKTIYQLDQLVIIFFKIHPIMSLRDFYYNPKVNKNMFFN